MEKREQTKTIFYTVLRPMFTLLIGEALLLCAILLLSNVIGNLNKSSENAVRSHVQHRAAYLGERFQDWADLDYLAQSITTATQDALDSGSLTLEDLNSDPEACTPIILNVMNDMITTIYAKRINGLFIMFNTEDLSQLPEDAPIPPKAGVCLRDSTDPTESASKALHWERAPESVTAALPIEKADNWRSSFIFSTDRLDEDLAFLAHALRAVFQAPSGTPNSDLGYWSATCQQDDRDTRHHGTTYTRPLTLEDGTIYAVLGVNIADLDLKQFLLSEELVDEGESAYFLAVAPDGWTRKSQFTPVLVQGSPDFLRGQSLELISKRGDYRYTAPDGTRYFAAAAEIPLYREDSPFAGEHWLLVGAANQTDLYALSRWVQLVLVSMVLAMLICGLSSSYLASRRLSRPIHALSQQVQQSRVLERIPVLPPTGITEIDQFSQAITTLSRNAVDASTRFLQIIRLASAELGGFEIRYDEDGIFVTENFFLMLGLLPIPQEELTVSLFLEIMDDLRREIPNEQQNDHSTLYTVAAAGGTQRYIRVKIIDMDQHQVGVAEDVTAAVLERIRVEHERDYDLLTGLYNRRAFYAKAGELFDDPVQLGHAALLMIDLDNLKYINDHYGHAWGDRYLSLAGQCFMENSPKGTLCARVSGDEFYLLLYGADNQELLRDQLRIFYNSMRATRLVLSSGRKVTLSASGGVAWYPEDSQSFQELMRYSDFAMYQAKHTHKGTLAEFDRQKFMEKTFTLQSHAEFRQLIDEQRVLFFFQPIVDARTGETRAYEALMRTEFPTLRGPGDVLRVAREMNMLREVECLTMLAAPAAYKKLLHSGQVEPDSFLFINSLANQYMTPEVREKYVAEVEELRPRVVIELTETENLSIDILREKMDVTGGQTPFALDDYGTGYNSERNLLMLSPQYVKVDMAIIRDIDRDLNKQHLVQSTVDYAHKRGMKIIAEGIETVAELNTVLSLDVDLLQGFLLARPMEVPAKIPEEIKAVIQKRPGRAAVPPDNGESSSGQ